MSNVSCSFQDTHTSTRHKSSHTYTLFSLTALGVRRTLFRSFTLCSPALRMRCIASSAFHNSSSPAPSSRRCFLVASTSFNSCNVCPSIPVLRLTSLLNHIIICVCVCCVCVSIYTLLAPSQLRVHVRTQHTYTFNHSPQMKVQSIQHPFPRRTLPRRWSLQRRPEPSRGQCCACS